MVAAVPWGDRPAAAGSGVVAVRRAKTQPGMDFCITPSVPKILRLVKMLEDHEPEERRSAVVQLGSLVNSPESASIMVSHTRLLSRMLRDKDGHVRSAVLSTLRKICEEGEAAAVGAQAPDISAGLEDKDIIVRQKAARLCRIIAEGGGGSSIALQVPHLLGCIELNEPLLRVTPLHALKAVVDSGQANVVAASASGVVLSALRDANAEVRTAASELLAAILRSGCELASSKAKDAGIMLDILLAVSRDPDPAARSAGKRALVRNVLADVCEQGRVSERNRLAWIATFDDKDLEEQKEVLLDMLRTNNVDRLKGMFMLCQQMPSVLSQFAHLFEVHCKEKFTEAARVQDAPPYIPQLMLLKTEFDEVVVQGFGNSSAFQTARDKGIAAVLNENTRCAKDLAHFCDSQLRKGWSSQDGDYVVGQVVSLFSHLRDKDVFLEAYRRALAQRLLNKCSASNEEEENFVAKLTLESGHYATRRLAAMLADMTLSSQLQEDYRKLSHGAVSQGVTHEVRVLRMNAWPGRFHKEQVTPCAELAACARAFEAFYFSKFSARKLTWNYSLGIVDIATSCFSRGHILAVSTYQCLALMLFNKRNEFTFQDICEATEIPREECKRQLLSMCVAKQSLLLQDPPAKEVSDTTRFVLNREFTSERIKVVITTLRKEENIKRATGADQTTERKHIMDATLIRIMKARRRLDNNTLLEEIFKQRLLFRPQPTQIKARIENLIERGFIRREPEDGNIFIYVP